MQADISTRHLSFVETGRASASRDMVLRLAEQLEVPLRERNELLLSAGYALAYAETPVDAPPMSAVREAIRQVLGGHEPYPAVVVDRQWNLVDANRAVGLFTEQLPAELLTPPINVLRATLHPRGMATRIVNLAEFRGHLLERLRRQVALTADAKLAARTHCFGATRAVSTRRGRKPQRTRAACRTVTPRLARRGQPERPYPSGWL